MYKNQIVKDKSQSKIFIVSYVTLKDNTSLSGIRVKFIYRIYVCLLCFFYYKNLVKKKMKIMLLLIYLCNDKLIINVATLVRKINILL